ncbi:permease prefix domain 1-containing protein [Leifsonia sp. NPDC080035]|uniref:Permease prefix domain 1-containing protein n=1 Tax=Leifsonia sp. NPDC080035 TaxID=3143936 RepID=A0AAU7GHN7_9MICO
MSDQHNAELDARLDEAFRSLPDTDDLRDLRDELRAGLAARVAELEAEGSGPAAAIATAFAELGDVREIAAEVVGPEVLATPPRALPPTAQPPVPSRPARGPPTSSAGTASARSPPSSRGRSCSRSSQPWASRSRC